MSASSSSGIQQLMKAEREAQDIVKEARTYRTQRLKASKADAVEEINKYKSEKESEFSSSTKHADQSEDHVETLSGKQAKTQIEAITKKSEPAKSKVVDFLLQTVCTPTVKVE